MAQLRQGITPRELALTVAFGATLSVFPVLGTTTLLCAATGVALRLNQPVIQLVNYAMTPVQLLLLIPFYRAGEALFGSTPVPLLDVPQLLARFRAAPWQFALDYGQVGVQGVAVWALVAPPAAWLLVRVTRPLLEGFARRLRARHEL